MAYDVNLDPSPVIKSLYSTKNKVLCAGAVVMYKGTKMVVRNVWSNGLVQLFTIASNGKFTDYKETPNKSEIDEVLGNFSLATYNGQMFFVTHKRFICSPNSVNACNGCYHTSGDQRYAIIASAYEFAKEHGWVVEPVVKPAVVAEKFNDIVERFKSVVIVDNPALEDEYPSDEDNTLTDEELIDGDEEVVDKGE